MTQDEIIEMAKQAGFAEPERIISTDTVRCVPDLAYFAELVAAKEREQSEPVAFKIYKPTPPRHATPNVRDADLPWVYDQDPSSGNVASMWVTPVKNTPQPQREWVGLTDTDIGDEYVRFQIQGGFNRFEYAARAIEAKLKEKNTP